MVRHRGRDGNPAGPEGMMADCDVTWLVSGLFLLACGGVPAVAALVTNGADG